MKYLMVNLGDPARNRVFHEFTSSKWAKLGHKLNINELEQYFNKRSVNPDPYVKSYSSSVFQHFVIIDSFVFGQFANRGYKGFKVEGDNFIYSAPISSLVFV